MHTTDWVVVLRSLGQQGERLCSWKNGIFTVLWFVMPSKIVLLYNHDFVILFVGGMWDDEP